MCGIFGIIGKNYTHDRRAIWAARLAHRGPDGAGEYEDARWQVYLAHRRLSVIDLSALGSQPMANEDGSLWISYNGEIYGFAALRRELQALGHHFRSATDTEVILHAYEEWGPQCLQRLNGMFAFAILDRRRGSLFLARDRLGIKPLYYAASGGEFAFASEATALVDLPFLGRSLQPQALVSYLLYKYVSGERSVWKGVQRLLPGHYLELDLASRQQRLRCYWDVQPDEGPASTAAALEEFDALFQQSVADSLVSDVPVGLFLSGGYDSSAVAAAVNREGRQLQSLSIGFEGWERDESADAAKTAASLGMPHRIEWLGEYPDGYLDTVVAAYDEPLADSSILPTWRLCEVARRQATVALSGDGADEMLAGYAWYGQTAHAAWHKSLAFALEPLVRQLGLQTTPWGRRCSSVDHYRLLTSPTLDLPLIRRLFPDLPAAELPNEEAYLYRQHLRADLHGVKRWMYLDLKTFLVDTNLAKVDRASMAHSLEVRVPFLDHRLVEFAFGLPEHLLWEGGKGKHLLALWLEKNGLQSVIKRPKRGFAAQWQRALPPAKLRQDLPTSWLVESGMVDGAALRKLCDNPSAGVDFQLWVLGVLNAWCRRHLS